MMVVFTVIVAILLSVFSTVVMGYIAMATPIGPWIAPTLVLIAILFFRMISQYSARSVVLVSVAGSVGGILATGCAFSFPAIYFLDADLFNTWMAAPWYFAGRLTAFAACAGGFGLMLANLFEYKMCVQDRLPFPIAILVSKMIGTGRQMRKAYELTIGFVLASLLSISQDGLCAFRGFIPKALPVMGSTVIAGVRIASISFDIWPLLWSIGFITGHVITLPLAVGAFSRLCVVDPLNVWFFRELSSVTFTFAFCSGMVLLGVVDSLLRVPSMVRQVCAWVSAMRSRTGGSLQLVSFARSINRSVNVIEQFLLFVGVMVMLWGIGFLWYQIVYLLLFAAIFSYQMVVIAAKWGMAPLGRFATFVMLPAMLLFKLDIVQIVFVALFVEVCGGVAYDILCGRMIAQKSNVDVVSVKRYQYLGLCVSSMVVGLLFWVLINACQLGSAELFAYKAQSRSLLINALMHGNGFNGYVLVLGFLFSFVLSKLSINPLLVLGGLLMPLNLSIGLIFGGMLTYLVKDREQWEPFWSGVFAANSVWMLLRVLF